MGKKKIIDPPSGWQFGFPRELPPEVENLGEWLVEVGYPPEDVDLALKYSRYWEEDSE